MTLIKNVVRRNNIMNINNYNTRLDISNFSIAEVSYMLESYIEESFSDLQIKCLMVDKRSLNESGVRYFTEENDAGKQKLGDKIKQIIKTVWDVIVGIFKKIRDFFKDMIDCLIGETSLPKGLKEQKDGKIVDHIYRDKSLVDQGDIYFIGDSKYYKEGNAIGENSRYKQFTYAKNVIQYHIDIFNKRTEGDVLRYRDELTEGYNPTPNFFIRGVVNPDTLSYHNSQLNQDKEGRYFNYHFENRLFDRDTLLVLTYDINFLYVLSAYVQSRGYSTSVDRFLREKFRQDILEAYQEEYDFYEIIPQNLTNEEFVEQYFKKLIGKIYQTREGKLILALKSEGTDEENQKLKDSLSSQASLVEAPLKH